MGAAEKAFQDATRAMNGGRPLEAEALFDKAIKLKPDLAEAWLGRGNAFAGMGRLDKALAAFDKALALKPALAGPWLGHLFANLGRQGEALAAYDKALAVRPDLAEAWLGRCHSLVKLERCAEALAAYERALAVDPRLAAPWLGHLFDSLGHHQEALAAYDRTLALKADLIEAWLGRGNVLFKLGRADDALAAYDRVLALKPDMAEAWVGRGNLLAELGRYDPANAAYDKAVALKPGLAEAWLGHGNLLVKQDRHAEAPAAYNKALALKPGLVEAWVSLGNVLGELERHAEAVAACDRAIALKPDMVGAWLGRGRSLVGSGRAGEGLAAVDKALALRPDLAEAWLGRGNALFKLERHGDALAAYDKALAIKPGLPEAWLGRGNVLIKLERPDEALAACDEALALKPDLAEALLGRGNALVELKRQGEALAAYDKASLLEPDVAEVWLGRGNALSRLKLPDEAGTAYGKALSLRPDLAEAWLGCGNLFAELERHDEALVAYDRALGIRSDLVEAWLGRGDLFTAAERHEEALGAYDRVLALKPDRAGLKGVRLRAKQNLCSWDDHDADCNHVIESVGRNEASTDPFTFLSLASSGSDQHKCARQWAEARHPPVRTPVWNGEIYKHDRIRLAYLSADFHEHATAYLMAGMLENHQRSVFDTMAISIGPRDSSAMRQRLAGAFESFLDAGRMSDAEVAAKIRSAEIDILVDLKGFTRNARTDILAHRAAPIQVNYLGYPGTMGASYVDYIIADRTVIPPSGQGDFSEKIAYLPDSYQSNDSGRSISDRTFTRGECGLPESGFVFCCFNNIYKITPDVFDRWMRILIKVEGSVLWLLEGTAAAAANLRKEAERRGVGAGRVVFAKRMPLPEHLARHRLADLFLDTLPYNAHTTASDALWAGLPVLTQLGETFAGRVAASLLNAIGLPELITHGSDAYEHLAIELATQPETLNAIRRKLARNRLTAPLFDTRLFTTRIETAYLAIYQRYQAGLAPDTFTVADAR
ncbi:tetratricopeptide repeat protein [Bradyrhizobium tropiciagri]|uniref:tetratricopeptide repeat protein n=1 Tax=Bradyrhizobium tropiciagri TaxID=312253 RepID=UPI001BA72F17|nr:tetratricopeptide repeat protein [Bradyrhizobium tropiciagri]MBR0873523.1 tetratricopeptide repeat protein [Bradyrhizobium tropiciagri]